MKFYSWVFAIIDNPDLATHENQLLTLTCVYTYWFKFLGEHSIYVIV